MLVKELYVKGPFSEEIEVLEKLEVKDSTEFKSFIKVKFLGTAENPKRNGVFYFNKNLILKIVPEFPK